MKKICYVLAALTTIAIAAPAIAQDRAMMHEGRHMDRGMEMRHHHHHHHMMRHIRHMMREGM
jgi:hypothetical protein